MVIDLILDRKEGSPYNPRDFYTNCMEYRADDITRSMDFGDNDSVKTALTQYINNNQYNPEIINYINSVNWI